MGIGQKGKIYRTPKTHDFTKYCVVPENIHTSPTEGFFSKTPHPSGSSN